MKIVKVFNNNAVVANDPLLGDVVLVGSGIAFQKKVNQEVEEHKIEKKYLFEENIQKRFKESLSLVPEKYYEVTMQIVRRAEQELGVEFNSEIFISISDHIAFSIRRKEKKVYLPNIILNETRMLYREEFEIGLWAIHYIKEKIGIELEEDEAGYIALHIINYSLSAKSNNASKIISFTKDVFKIIELTMNVELDNGSLAYARLSTHLKYLGGRIFREEAEALDTTSSFRDLLNHGELLYLCINRIKKLIKKRYNYDISLDEETYLYIHINNNVCSTKQDK